MNTAMVEELENNNMLDNGSGSKCTNSVKTIEPSLDIDKAIAENITAIEPIEEASVKSSGEYAEIVKDTKSYPEPVYAKGSKRKDYSHAELKDKYESMSADRLGDIWKIYRDKKLTEDQLAVFEILRKVYEVKTGRKLTPNTQSKRK